MTRYVRQCETCKEWVHYRSHTCPPKWWVAYAKDELAESYTAHANDAEEAVCIFLESVGETEPEDLWVCPEGKPDEVKRFRCEPDYSIEYYATEVTDA